MEKKNLRQKLFSIQKELKTFAVEDSGTNSKGTYLYTPGWKIVETVRSLMDREGIMLDSNTVGAKTEMVSFPVYRNAAGGPSHMRKRCLLPHSQSNTRGLTLKAGETIGPYTHVSCNQNDIDKSMSTAESFNERYFFLKYFHITTRDKSDEADATNEQALPGMDGKSKHAAAMPAYNSAQPGIQPAQVQAPVKQATKAPVQPSLQKEKCWNDAVKGLSYFDRDTTSRKDALNWWLSSLREAGWDTSAQGFAQRLEAGADAIRYGTAN